MKTSRACWFLVAMSTIAMACASSQKAPSKSAGDSALARTGANATDQDSRTQGRESVQVDDRIAKACKLSETYFPFDSARVDSSSSSGLDALARCFVSGPLQGKEMKLVGHADPRGEVEYNFGLGQQRAASVARFLESRGMHASRMSTLSRGEIEASGTDDAGWAKDRKVQILLDD